MLILKGILLYITVLYVILIMMAADSLMDNGTLLYGTIIGAILLLACHFLLTEKDLKVLTFYNKL